MSLLELFPPAEKNRLQVWRKSAYKSSWLNAAAKMILRLRIYLSLKKTF